MADSTARWVLWATMAGVALPVAGCVDFFSDASEWAQGPVGSGGAGGTGGTTNTTIDPGCIPRGSSDPVRADCGVFVSSSMGSDDNDGSQAKPFATIATAIAAAQSEPIYLCAETFPESVHLTSGVKIFGGLDCANGWKLVGDTTKSEVSPAAGEVPLVLSTGVKATLVDLALHAKDAIVQGASSIAVIASKDADLGLSYCDVVAGVAMKGADGEAFAMNASTGGMGNPGADACPDANVNGGASAKNACDGGDPNDDSIGGKGGSSDEFSGGAGSPGLPDGAPNGGAGEGGAACMAGTVGNDGAAGTAATGAAGMGSITGQGYAGSAGNAGDKGKPGQGGGGGGGAKGGTAANQCTVDAVKTGGASGGSGGSGGCGGLGGKGGQAGGASIGIVSIGAKLTLEDVKLTAKAGGKGGAGSDGQLGGMGGLGGTGGSKGAASSLKKGCPGGSGGSGGAGGKGGGGLGGHSIGIAYTGDAPDVQSATITTAAAGDGGAGDGDTGMGAKGVAAPTQAF